MINGDSLGWASEYLRMNPFEPMVGAVDETGYLVGMAPTRSNSVNEDNLLPGERLVALL